MDVVELLAGHRAQYRLDVLDVALDPGVALDDLGLGGVEDTVEPPQHGQRQDDLPVLGLLVVAPQQVGNRPDECCMRLDRGCVAHLTLRDAPPRRRVGAGDLPS